MLAIALAAFPGNAAIIPVGLFHSTSLRALTLALVPILAVVSQTRR